MTSSALTGKLSSLCHEILLMVREAGFSDVASFPRGFIPEGEDDENLSRALDKALASFECTESETALRTNIEQLAVMLEEYLKLDDINAGLAAECAVRLAQFYSAFDEEFSDTLLDGMGFNE